MASATVHNLIATPFSATDTSRHGLTSHNPEAHGREGLGYGREGNLGGGGEWVGGLGDNEKLCVTAVNKGELTLFFYLFLFLFNTRSIKAVVVSIMIVLFFARQRSCLFQTGRICRRSC